MYKSRNLITRGSIHLIVSFIALHLNPGANSIVDAIPPILSLDSNKRTLFPFLPKIDAVIKPFIPAPIIIIS